MARIILCHEFFWPDAAPYGSILKAIGEHWTKNGKHEVCIFTSRPDKSRSLGRLSYDDEDSKTELKIVRVSLPFSSKSKSKVARFVNSIVFASKFIWFARKSAPFDLIMNSTMPPLFSGVAGFVASKMARARWIYHVMDIFPEVIEVSEPGSNQFLFRKLLAVLTRIDTWAVSKAARLIVLSDDMRRTMLQRGGKRIKPSQLEVQANFALPDWSGDKCTGATEIPWGSDATKVVFVGNLGRFQGLDRILQGYLDAVAMGATCELAFVGDGIVADDLKSIVSKSGCASVHFTGLLSRFAADQIILEADVCIVSLAYGVERVAFPTKIGSYLVQGKALFAVGKKDSSLESLVSKNNVGCFADILSVSEIANAFAKCADQESRRSWTRSARSFGESYTPERVYPFWDAMLSKVLREPTANISP